MEWVDFSAGIDSPVSVDSSILREKTSINLMSAGTISPAESKTISPGTKSTVGIEERLWLRITFENGEDILRSASSDFSALNS